MIVRVRTTLGIGGARDTCRKHKRIGGRKEKRKTKQKKKNAKTNKKS